MSLLLIIENVLLALSLCIPLLLAVAFFTHTERKVMSAIQRRIGPNVQGVWGLTQAVLDGMKLLNKEVILPGRANPYLFLLAPILMFAISFSSWAFIPFNLNACVSDVNLGLLVLFLFSTLNVYTLILAGWSSNSQYPLLGAVRAVAQMISYEIVMGFCLLCVVILSGSMNLIDIVVSQQNGFYIFPLLPVAVVFFIVALAETNRAPFDLPEAESELVAGYNVEYSSILFAMFFLAEYCNILLMAALWVILFWGGWIPPLDLLWYLPPGVIFAVKIVLVAIFFIIVRAALPRYRYDQLMSVGWEVLLPLVFGYFILLCSILLFSDSLPSVQVGTYVDCGPSQPVTDTRAWITAFNSPKEEDVISYTEGQIVLLGLAYWVVFASNVFIIGFVGVAFSTRNLIVLLLNAELANFALSLLFVILGVHSGHAEFQTYALLLLAVSAAESVIGLSVAVSVFKHYGTTDLRVISRIHAG